MRVAQCYTDKQTNRILVIVLRSELCGIALWYSFVVNSWLENEDPNLDLWIQLAKFLHSEITSKIQRFLRFLLYEIWLAETFFCISGYRYFIGLENCYSCCEVQN